MRFRLPIVAAVACMATASIAADGETGQSVDATHLEQATEKASEGVPAQGDSPQSAPQNEQADDC